MSDEMKKALVAMADDAWDAKRSSDANDDGAGEGYRMCPECGGNGTGADRIDGLGDVYQEKCGECDGQGRIALRPPDAKRSCGQHAGYQHQCIGCERANRPDEATICSQPPRSSAAGIMRCTLDDGHAGPCRNGTTCWLPGAPGSAAWQGSASPLEDERFVIVSWLRQQARGVRKVPGERGEHEAFALLIASDSIARGDHMKGRAPMQPSGDLAFAARELRDAIQAIPIMIGEGITYDACVRIQRAETEVSTALRSASVTPEELRLLRAERDQWKEAAEERGCRNVGLEAELKEALNKSEGHRDIKPADALATLSLFSIAKNIATDVIRYEDQYRAFVEQLATATGIAYQGPPRREQRPDEAQEKK